MLHFTQLTGMLGTVALDHWACLFKLHSASVHVCSTCSQPAAQATLPQGQQTYLPLRIFAYVALDQHTCLKSISYVCNRFTRLAGMLQYPCFKRCFEPTGMFVAVAPDHLARRLQLISTSMQSCIYQQICLNQLQLTNKYICSCVAEPTGIYVALASDAHICPYARTQLMGWYAQLHQTIMDVFYICT